MSPNVKLAIAAFGLVLGSTAMAWVYTHAIGGFGSIWNLLLLLVMGVLTVGSAVALACE